MEYNLILRFKISQRINIIYHKWEGTCLQRQGCVKGLEQARITESSNYYETMSILLKMISLWAIMKRKFKSYQTTLCRSHSLITWEDFVKHFYKYPRWSSQKRSTIGWPFNTRRLQVQTCWLLIAMTRHAQLYAFHTYTGSWTHR